MDILVQANILAVGLDGKAEALGELPIRLVTTQSAVEAARYLKNENCDTIISKWDLEDMKNGLFLRRLRVVKPYIRTIPSLPFIPYLVYVCIVYSFKVNRCVCPTYIVICPDVSHIFP